MGEEEELPRLILTVFPPPHPLTLPLQLLTPPPVPPPTSPPAPTALLCPPPPFSPPLRPWTAPRWSINAIEQLVNLANRPNQRQMEGGRRSQFEQPASEETKPINLEE